MEQGTKRTLIISASILIGATALTFIAKAIVNKIKAKKEAKRQELLKEEITGGGSTTQENIEAQQTYNPASHIKLLEGYIVGANFMVYPDEVNGIIMKLNNADLKKLANAWKQKYNGQTLYYWLDDEWDKCGNWGLDNCYASAMNRLSSLGLS
jgi:hypothetical protein